MKTKRSKESLLRHYKIESELAKKLSSAGSEERKSLYTEVYNEMFARVPDHPMLTEKSCDENLNNERELHFQYILPMLSSNINFLEIGPGDCKFSMRVSELVAKVFSVDVSDEISKLNNIPDNMEIIISDGVSIPVGSNFIDIAYSNQLMEHLHPDDAYKQLENIYNVLRNGGKYLCITPNKYNGPHDISKYFSDVAKGFHLKEYTYSDISHLLKKVGFEKIELIAFIKGKPFKIPSIICIMLEYILSIISRKNSLRIAKLPLIYNILGINIIAEK